MKLKHFLIIIIIFSSLIIPDIFAINKGDKILVSLNKCIDGDTASFNYKDEVLKVRFLAVDTPESVHPTKEVEPFGVEASEYTCNKLTDSSVINLEFDLNSEVTDKYDRYLAWVIVDSDLLNNLIIEKGLGEVKYLYGNYKYTDVLKKSESVAKKNNLGIWSDYVAPFNYDILIVIGGIIVIILMFIFSKKYRKKITNKARNKAKKQFNKSFKNILK